MAGCRPEYMPVLLAVIEAIIDPVYKIEDAVVEKLRYWKPKRKVVGNQQPSRIIGRFNDYPAREYGQATGSARHPRG